MSTNTETVDGTLLKLVSDLSEKVEVLSTNLDHLSKEVEEIKSQNDAEIAKNLNDEQIASEYGH